MNIIQSIEELESLYNAPPERAITKVATAITPLYRQWIEASRFVVISTVGEGGCDVSPRGDRDKLVQMPNASTIWLPDWSGNNRLDSLRNIVGDGRASLMFMVNGCNNVVRVNATALLSIEPDLKEAFRRRDKLPKIVIVLTVQEVYFQCAKALMRSELWKRIGVTKKLPSAGEFLKEQDDGFDSVTYDADYHDRATKILW